MLPPVDDDKNARPWHAKMLTLRSEAYSALMIGSSNFTCAGMGVTPHRHAEANLLTLVDRVASGRESGRLEAIWPEMEMVTDPDAAEWLGAKPEDEDEQATTTALPAGFLSATYRAGEVRQIVLRLDAAHRQLHLRSPPRTQGALWCFAETDSFEAAILRAANLGDDADTTAAVCGQVAGAYYGESGIPSRWLERLAKRMTLLTWQTALCRHSRWTNRT